MPADAAVVTGAGEAAKSAAVCADDEDIGASLGPSAVKAIDFESWDQLTEVT